LNKWEKTETIAVLPPQKKKMLGKPKKKRNLERLKIKKDETQLKMTNIIKKYNICLETSHNIRTCPRLTTQIG